MDENIPYEYGRHSATNLFDRSFGADPQPVKDMVQLMLCRIRQSAKGWPEEPVTGWEYGPYGRGRYRSFMKQTDPKVALPGSLDELRDVSIWHGLTGAEILAELRGCSDGCRKLFDRHLDRYLGAAWAYLLDIVPEEQYERLKTARTVTIDDIPGGDEHEQFRNKYYELHPEVDGVFIGGFPLCFGPSESDYSAGLLVMKTAEVAASTDNPIVFSQRTVMFQRIFTMQKILALLFGNYGAASLKVEQLQQPEASENPDKVPGGFIGFCYEKIAAMPAEERKRFLSTNPGDSSFYHLRDKWNLEWKATGKTPYKKPGEGISKAKNIYREMNDELKN